MNLTKWARIIGRITPVILAFMLLLIGPAACNQGPTPTPMLTATLTPTPRLTDLGANLVTHEAFPSLSYGIQAFLWWNAFTRSRDLERVRQMRFDYVKQIADWNSLRAGPNLPYDWTLMDDVVNETQYRQLKLVIRLGKPPYWVILPPNSDPNEPPIDLNAFGEYCHAMAARYKGRIAGYQVWNEPNLAREWQGRAPNPAAYVKFLKTCYTNIKSADPDAVVISAPLAPTGNNDAFAMSDDLYLQRMFDAGLSSYYDVLGLNAPGFKVPPETAPDDPILDGGRWATFRRVEDMRAVQVSRGDGAKQVALLEVGWTTDTRQTVVQDGKIVTNQYAWIGHDESTQADYLQRDFEYAAQHWRPWVGLMVVIYMPDPTWTKDNEEYWWSIAYPGNSTLFREAFYTLTDMPRYIDKITIPPLAPGANPYQPLPPASPTPMPTATAAQTASP